MKIKKILKYIYKLKTIKLIELLIHLKKKFNIINNNNNNNNNNNDNNNNNNNYTIKLNNIGEKKIALIKLVKEITNKTLIESKNLINNIPCILLKIDNKKKAIEIINKINNLGANAEII